MTTEEVPDNGASHDEANLFVNWLGGIWQRSTSYNYESYSRAIDQGLTAQVAAAWRAEADRLEAEVAEPRRDV